MYGKKNFGVLRKCCIVCGKIFDTIDCKRTQNIICCGKECKIKLTNAKNIISRLEKYTSEPQKYCKCGNKIDRTLSIKGRQYCSRSCVSKYMDQTQKKLKLKGRPLSLSARRAVSLSNKTRVVTDATRKKLSIAGKKNYKGIAAIIGKYSFFSKAEQYFAEMLLSNGIEYEQQLRYSYTAPKGDKRYGFADFYFKKYNLVVELDGIYWHRNKQDIDEAKTKALKRQGYYVLRMASEWNMDQWIFLLLRKFKSIERREEKRNKRVNIPEENNGNQE